MTASEQTCWKGRAWACLRSRCCCCCCKSFIWISCCCDVMACREGGCIMAPERRCSMLDRACLVLVGTKEPAGSSLEPPAKATKKEGFFEYVKVTSFPHFTKMETFHLLTLSHSTSKREMNGLAYCCECLGSVKLHHFQKIRGGGNIRVNCNFLIWLHRDHTSVDEIKYEKPEVGLAGLSFDPLPQAPKVLRLHHFWPFKLVSFNFPNFYNLVPLR